MGQGQTAGDTTAAKAGDTHGTATATDNANGQDNLHNAAYNKDAATPKDSTTVRDTTRVGDHLAGKIRDTTEKPAAEAQGHLHNAQVAAVEIAKFLKEKKETDTITYKGEDGKEHTSTVGARVAELKRIVDREASAAVGASNGIKKADVAGLVQDTRNDRNLLASQLGVDTKTLTSKTLTDRIATASPEQKPDLQRLLQVQQNLEKFVTWQNLPAGTRMQYANLKGAGLTNPDSGMTLDKNGQLKPVQKDVVDAVQLLTEAAASNRELTHSRLYIDAVNTILPKLENSTEKVASLTKNMNDAVNAGARGDKVEQERLLKEAVATADSTNTAAIAQLLRDPKFVDSQRKEGVIQDMANNVVLASTARLQYAQFLANDGRFGEAQALMLKVKTECPEVIQKPDPNSPSGWSYKESRFVNMKELDEQLAASTTVKPNQIEGLMEKMGEAMSKGQFVTKDGVRGALDIATDMKTAATKKAAEVADGLKGLDAAQKQLDEQKRALDGKTYLTEGARKIEQDQIDREGAMIRQQREMLNRDAKEATRLTNVAKLYEASVYVATEERGTARDLLAQVKAADPELAAMKAPDGSAGFYEQMEKASVEPSWWDSHWRQVCYGVAIGAGIVAGALTFWTGPGAVLAGAGTTAGLCAAMGLTVGVAAVTGAVAGTATHFGLNKAGLVKEEVQWGKELLTYGEAGAMGGLLVASVPLMAAAGTIGGTTAAVEGGAVVATETLATATAASTAASAEVVATTAATTATTAAATETAVATTSALSKLTTIGINAGRMGLVQGTGAGTYSLIDHYANNRTWGETATQTGLYTAFGMVPAVSSPVMKFVSAPVARAFGMAPAAETALTATAFSVPKLTPGAMVWVGVGVGANETFKAVDQYALADAMGPLYAYGTGDGKPTAMSQSTALFGPWGNTRGWQPGRQDPKAGAGENTYIQLNWNNIDPGLAGHEQMGRETIKAPIIGTESDFTAAEKLRLDEQP